MARAAQSNMYGITVTSVLFLAYYHLVRVIIFKQIFYKIMFTHPHVCHWLVMFGTLVCDWLVIVGILDCEWLILGTLTWPKCPPVNVYKTAVFRGRHYSLVFTLAKPLSTIIITKRVDIRTSHQGPLSGTTQLWDCGVNTHLTLWGAISPLVRVVSLCQYHISISILSC